MLPFGVTIFSFFTHTGEKKHKEKPWETTAGWEGTLTFLEKDIAQRRGNPRRGFPLFLAMPKIHPFLRFGSTGEFRRLRTATKGFALGTHFLFFREAKGSEKKLMRPAGLVSQNALQSSLKYFPIIQPTNRQRNQNFKIALDKCCALSYNPGKPIGKVGFKWTTTWAFDVAAAIEPAHERQNNQSS